MLHDQTFAFIGSGAMGEAMIKGLISQANLPPQQITASDPREERGTELQAKYGVRTTTDNLDAVSGAKIVVLSVKPQVLHPVMTQLTGHIAPDALVLSIVAGARTEIITTVLLHKAVVRSMPNTPAQISEGITVWIASPSTSAEQREQARKLLQALGEEVGVGGTPYTLNYRSSRVPGRASGWMLPSNAWGSYRNRSMATGMSVSPILMLLGRLPKMLPTLGSGWRRLHWRMD